MHFVNGNFPKGKNDNARFSTCSGTYFKVLFRVVSKRRNTSILVKISE